MLQCKTLQKGRYQFNYFYVRGFHCQVNIKYHNIPSKPCIFNPHLHLQQNNINEITMMCYHLQPSLQQRCHSPLAPVTGDVPHWLLSPCVCCTPREPLNTMVVAGAGPAASLPVPVSGASCTPHMSPHCPAHLTTSPHHLAQVSPLYQLGW